MQKDTKINGCSKHGPYEVCGHTDENCPANENSTSSEKQEKDKPEAWVNQEREKAYQILIEEVRQAYKDGKSGGQYLAELIQQHVTDYGTKVRFGNWLKPEEQDKIEFILFTSKSLNEVAGMPIERPLFMIRDEKLYSRIEAMFDIKPGSGHGVHFSPGLFDKKTQWEKVGLIIVTDNAEIATHETRHSVDPLLAHNSEKRKGFDQAVAELFAYYKVFVMDKKDPDWDGLIQQVGVYHKFYEGTTKEKMTPEEYTNKIKMAVAGLAKFREKHGDLETQRQLVQIKTLDELIAFAE